ncbi:hypothetical protein [Streptomyces anulatus]|uniref:hypothetical protein n=1 Tax=Streptomyces anulatus TaxID=1892 RepID=UPI003868AB29|nr:hypothetical protein OG882_21475 [Streptomyces anulatus]
MTAEDERGTQIVSTPADYDPEGTQIVGTPVDYDPEDVQLSARTDDVVMYLPEITYLDTQPWSVEIGLTPDRLVQLRDALDNHLRGAADHAGPANRGDTPTVATPSEGAANGNRGDIATVEGDTLAPSNGSRGDTPTTGPDGGTACPPVVGLQPTTVVQLPIVVAQQATTVTETVTVPLRERLRAALRRHIDPDDDTMPELWRGGFLWVDTDEVLDNLIKALDSPDPIEVIARVSAAVDTPSGPPEEPTSEYGIGWDTAMDLIRAAIEEQP